MPSDNISEILHIFQDDLFVYPMIDDMQAIEQSEEFPKNVVLALRSDQLESNQALLVKMLAACKLQANEYKIIYLEKEQDAFAYCHIPSIETIWFFGIQPSTDAFQLQHALYKPFRFHQKKMLLCDSISAIATNDALKSALWIQGLKPLYKV